MKLQKSIAPIGKHQFSLVLPINLFAKLRKIAITEKTSLNKLILNAIQEVYGEK